jgi:hypothetical protein
MILTVAPDSSSIRTLSRYANEPARKLRWWR